MDYKLMIKGLAPSLVMTNKRETSISDLEKVAVKLFKIGKEAVNSSSAICLCEDMNCKEEMKIEVCLPVAQQIITDEEVEFKVLPRIKVVSVSQLGTEVMEGAHKELVGMKMELERYLAENDLEVIAPYRIIYHKISEEGRRTFFTRKQYKYKLEIQAPYELPY